MTNDVQRRASQLEAQQQQDRQDAENTPLIQELSGIRVALERIARAMEHGLNAGVGRQDGPDKSNPG